MGGGDTIFLYKILPILLLITATLFGDSIPRATAPQPASQLIGETFSQQLCFDNNGTQAGFEPQFEIVTPVGIKLNTATFGGNPTISHQETCMTNDCNVSNPIIGQPSVLSPIDGNESYYILDFPIGSFSTQWPEQCMDLTFELESSGNHVQVGNPLDIKTVGVFSLGETPVDDGNYTYGPELDLTVIPNVYTIKKSNSATEGERATGEKYPITATIVVDIAKDENLTNLQVVDDLDGGMQFLSLISDGGCTQSQLPSTTSPGGTLNLDCNDTTGVLGSDINITYTYYIPESDANNDLILGGNCQWKPLVNHTHATANHDFNNTQTSLAQIDANSTVTAKAITMHKTSNIQLDNPPVGFGPADIIEYTLTMDISGYATQSNIVISDTIGDGQSYVVATPNSYALSSGATGDFNASNINVTYDGSTGTSLIEFDLSTQLFDDGRPSTVDANTTITVTFLTKIDSQYKVINNQDHIAMGDVVENTVLLNTEMNGTPCPSEPSHTSNTVATEQLTKTIYAINSNPPGVEPYLILPGDNVTYRLKSVMPVASFHDFRLLDYLPIPFFKATQITGQGSDGSTLPGTWAVGPDNTYGTPPILTVDAGQNSLTWNFADDNSTHRATVLDLIFTVTATNEPMADALTLANIGGTKYKNSAGQDLGTAGLITVITQEPKIEAEHFKSIISSTNTNSSLITAPVDFDSAMDKVDANDTITYQIHLENTGHATAYDINVSDRFEQGANVGQGLHSCTILNIDQNGTGTGSGDLFTGMYSVDYIEAGVYYKINYTCVVNQDANPGADIDNTATLLSYASSPSGPNFVAKLIESKAKLKLTNKMEIVKNIVSTSIPATSGNSINQGEIVNFEINVTLGEGNYSNYVLTDNACTGITLQSTSANVQISGTTVEVLGTGGSVDGNLSYICEKQAVTSGTNTASVTADIVGSKIASTNWTVVPPNVVTQKKMNPRNVDAGDLVTVRLKWTNDASHPAYKCKIIDPLNPAVFDVSTINPFFTPAGYTYSLVGNEVQYIYTGDFTQPCPNGEARFSINVRADVNTSANITNEMSLQGGTLPDGHTGENNTSINGSVDANATAKLNVRSPVRPVKILTATSENFTDPGDVKLNNTPEVAIGEVIDVELTFGFYEGTTLDVDLDERFLNGGRLVYVHSTMQISRSDANLTVEDTDINSALVGSPINTFVAVDDSKLAIGTTQVRLHLGNVVNSNTTNGVAPANLVLHFRVKVQNKSSVQTGALIRDRGRVRYRDSVSNKIRNSQSSIRSARTYEPLPTIVKSVSQNTVEAGTALTYTIQVCNDENNQTGNPHRATSAFDWSISDRLADEIQPTGVFMVDAGTTGANVNVTVSGQDINGTIDRLDRGECVSIDYDAVVQPTAHFGQILTNRASFQTTSLPGLNGTAGVLAGLTLQNSGQLNGERTGDGSRGGLNNFHGTNDATVTVSKGVIVKELINPQPYYAIGEKAHYQIGMGVPRGISENTIIYDTLPAGLDFNISDVSVIVGAGMTVTHNPPIITQNGQVISFDFGELNATTLSGLRIDYNVTVNNTLGNQDGTRLDNDANATYNDPNNVGQTITLTPINPAQSVIVGEANLNMQKRIISGAVKAQASSVIRWEVTIANNGNTMAYATDWLDTLPSHLAQISNYTLALHGAPAVFTGTSSAITTADLIENNTTLALPLFDLPVGSSIVITFDSVAQNTVIAGETQTNNTDTKYQSLLNGGRGNSDCGDDDNDATLNNYCESASADLVIDASIFIDKHLQGMNDKFTIGDEVTYEMRVAFIEGNIANVVLTDTLPAGLSYVSHARQDGPSQIQYDFTRASTNNGTSSNVIIEFGDINNSADGNKSNDFIDVELTARVDNVVGNQEGYKPENGDIAGILVTVTSDANASAVTVPVPITVTEPNLQVSKTVTPSSQALGDIVTYHIKVTHTGVSTADAYDVNFTDVLDAGLEYIPGSAKGATVTQNGQTLRFEFAHIAQVDSIDITYQARIATGATVGTALRNNLDTVYGSLPDANGTVLGARNGLDGVGGALNNYALHTQVPITPNNNELNITKELNWIDSNNDGLISVGDQLDYNISIHNPYGYTVGDVNVTDSISSFMTYLPNTLVLSDTLNGNSIDDTNPQLLLAWITLLTAGETNYLTFSTVINSTAVTHTDVNNTANVDSNSTVPTTSNEVSVTTDQRGIAGLPDKNITGSDQAFTNLPNVAVGEIIDVKLTFEFTGGLIKQVVLRDNFDLQHFVYVPNSSTLERSSTSIQVSQSDINASFVGANPVIIDDSNISHDANGFALDVGDIVNSHYEEMNMTESLIWTFKLRVDNNTSVQHGNLLNDYASVLFSEHHSDTNTSSISEVRSPNKGVIVVEPDVEISKTVNPLSAFVGNTLMYKLKVCNDESNTSTYTTTGFEWHITDTLPVEFDLVGNPQYNANPMFINAGRDLDVMISSILPGDCEILEYNVTINGAAQFDQEINNTVRVESSSLPGNVAGERTGTGVVPNILYATNTASLMIEAPGVRKEIIGQKNYYPIGDIVQYVITLGFTGSSRDLTVIDNFPSGLSYVPNSASVRVPTDTNISHNPPVESNSGNIWTFFIGDLNITQAGNLYLELNATVEDIVSNVDGTQLINSIDMTFTDPNTGAPDTISSISPPITVGEPDLHVSKTITSDLSVPKNTGDIISYKIILENNGTTTAYNVDWEDKIPVHTGDIHNAHQEVITGTAYLTGTTTRLSDTDFVITTVDEPDDMIKLQRFDLSAGATLVITFDTIIQPNVIPAETMVNITGATTQSTVTGGRKHDGGINGGHYASVATVSFSINKLPEAIDDCSPPLLVTHYGQNPGNLGANDILGDGTKTEHIWRVVTQPQHGTVVVYKDGTYSYTPYPNINYVQDSFIYEIEDSNGDKDQAKVCIDVQCASSQTSDGGSAFGFYSGMLMILFSTLIGLYFVRREEKV